MTGEELAEIKARVRAESRRNLFGTVGVLTLLRVDVPKLLAEVERLQGLFIHLEECVEQYTSADLLEFLYARHLEFGRG